MARESACPIQLPKTFLQGTQLSGGLVSKEAGRGLLFSCGGSDVGNSEKRQVKQTWPLSSSHVSVLSWWKFSVTLIGLDIPSKSKELSSDCLVSLASGNKLFLSAQEIGGGEEKLKQTEKYRWAKSSGNTNMTKNRGWAFGKGGCCRGAKSLVNAEKLTGALVWVTVDPFGVNCLIWSGDGMYLLCLLF